MSTVASTRPTRTKPSTPRGKRRPKPSGVPAAALFTPPPRDHLASLIDAVLGIEDELEICFGQMSLALDHFDHLPAEPGIEGLRKHVRGLVSSIASDLLASYRHIIDIRTFAKCAEPETTRAKSARAAKNGGVA